MTVFRCVRIYGRSFICNIAAAVIRGKAQEVEEICFFQRINAGLGGPIAWQISDLGISIQPISIAAAAVGLDPAWLVGRLVYRRQGLGELHPLLWAGAGL